MKTSHYRFPVRLGEEQRRFLETMMHTGIPLRLPSRGFAVLLAFVYSRGIPLRVPLTFYHKFN